VLVSCQHCNEPSGSTDVECPDQLSDSVSQEGPCFIMELVVCLFIVGSLVLFICVMPATGIFLFVIIVISSDN
jgi:hypothetical protein